MADKKDSLRWHVTPPRTAAPIVPGSRAADGTATCHALCLMAVRAPCSGATLAPEAYSPRACVTSLKLPFGMRGMRRKPAAPYRYGANCASATCRNWTVPTGVWPRMQSPSHSQSATSARICVRPATMSPIEPIRSCGSGLVIARIVRRAEEETHGGRERQSANLPASARDRRTLSMNMLRSQSLSSSPYCFLSDLFIYAAPS
jgi:hypothetical protein